MLSLVTQLHKPFVHNSGDYHAICHQFKKIPLFIFYSRQSKTLTTGEFLKVEEKV